MDFELFFQNVVVSVDSLVINHDQSFTSRTVYLVERCFPIMDLMDASMIQALWLLGLLMNDSMQEFVTSMSGDLYPASIYRDCSVGVHGGGDCPPVLVRGFYESHSFGF